MTAEFGFGKRIAVALRVLRGGGAGDYARVATLEMDVKERDERIERLQREFALERRRAETASSGAVDAGIEELARKAAGLFANLRAMCARHERGDRNQHSSPQYRAVHGIEEALLKLRVSR